MPAVTYNSYTLPLVTGKFSHGEDFRGARVSCEFLVAASSASALVTACNEAELKLSEINKDLTVSHGGSSNYSYSHSSNTGFLARPRVDKIADQRATELTRAYRFSCEIQLPMTQYGAARSRTYSISQGASRQRTVSFQVEYTASGSDSAETTYAHATTGGKAWAAGVLTALGGVYELVSESRKLEQETKTLSASLAYKEILFAQSAGGADHASIVDCTATYSVDFAQQRHRAQTSGVEPSLRVQVTISYSATVSRDSVASATSMDAVYHSTVRPYLINQAMTMLGLSHYGQADDGYVILSERKSHNPYSYSISGSVTFLANSASAILDFVERIQIHEDSGIVDVPIWDGIANTYSSWTIGGTVRASRTVSVGQLGSPPATPPVLSDVARFGFAGTWGLRRRNTMFEDSEWGAGTGTISGTDVRARLYYSRTWSEDYVLVGVSEYPDILLPQT